MVASAWSLKQRILQLLWQVLKSCCFLDNIPYTWLTFSSHTSGHECEQCYRYRYFMPLRTCSVSAIELIAYNMVVKRSLKCVILFFLKASTWCSPPSNLQTQNWCEDNIEFRTADCTACNREAPRAAGISVKHLKCMRIWGELILRSCCCAALCIP